MSRLRDYQESAVGSCLDYINSNSNKPGIVVAPTAAGKSWIIAGIAKRYKNQILVLQPSLELLLQNYEKLKLMGGDASLYSNSVKSKEIGHITYAILPSIKNNAIDFKNNNVKLVIIDECHYKISPESNSMFSRFIKELNPDKVIGLTATPFRLKSNMAGSRLAMLNRMRPGYFKHFIHVTQISDIINKGFWSPSVDEEWIMDEDKLILNSNGTEFTEESVKEAIETNGINNKIYLRIRDLQSQGKRKSILVFVDSVETCEKFCQHIPNSSYVSGETSNKKRLEIVDKFKKGEINVVFNFGVFTTGFDHPELDCIIMGRPTNSLAMFYQIYGRGVRVSENKENFLFIDYCNNFRRLGHPRKISIENYPGHGWGVFSGDRLVTSIQLDGPEITKSDLDDKNLDIDYDMVFPFGKFKDQKVSIVCKEKPWYINFLIDKDWLDPVFRDKIIKISKHIQINGNRVVVKQDKPKNNSVYSGPLK